MFRMYNNGRDFFKHTSLNETKSKSASTYKICTTHLVNKTQLINLELKNLLIEKYIFFSSAYVAFIQMNG